jgi:hypothetical protein
MANEQATGVTDERYDLISVLYHATHGAWNYEEYISDAEQKGDDQLAQFFREVRDENKSRAQTAKSLLATRLQS